MQVTEQVRRAEKLYRYNYNERERGRKKSDGYNYNYRRESTYAKLQQILEIYSSQYEQVCNNSSDGTR